MVPFIAAATKQAFHTGLNACGLMFRIGGKNAAEEEAFVGKILAGIHVQRAGQVQAHAQTPARPEGAAPDAALRQQVCFGRRFGVFREVTEGKTMPDRQPGEPVPGPVALINMVKHPGAYRQTPTGVARSGCQGLQVASGLLRLPERVSTRSSPWPR